jgi:hypothetical protein
MLTPFSNFSQRIAIHQMPMLQAGVRSAILFPLQSNKPVMPAPATQHS